jgi:hypothetical protein
VRRTSPRSTSFKTPRLIGPDLITSLCMSVAAIPNTIEDYMIDPPLFGEVKEL